MRKISAHRRHISHLRVGDHRCQCRVAVDISSASVQMLQVPLPRVNPPIFKKSALFLNIRKTGDAVDIDQMAGPRQAQLHHGDKTLSATQDLGIVTMLLQQATASGTVLGLRYSKAGGIMVHLFQCQTTNKAELQMRSLYRRESRYTTAPV